MPIWKREYTVKWTEDVATITWYDGLIQQIILDKEELSLLEAGHDPVEEMWEDGNGNAVCRANATEGGF